MELEGHGVLISREYDLYQESKIVLPPQSSVAATPITALYSQVKTGYTGVPVPVQEHVLKNWKPNPTVLVGELQRPRLIEN